jgi:hypothetical protein
MFHSSVESFKDGRHPTLPASTFKRTFFAKRAVPIGSAPSDLQKVNLIFPFSLLEGVLPGESSTYRVHPAARFDALLTGVGLGRLFLSK